MTEMIPEYTSTIVLTRPAFECLEIETLRKFSVSFEELAVTNPDTAHAALLDFVTAAPRSVTEVVTLDGFTISTEMDGQQVVTGAAASELRGSSYDVDPRDTIVSVAVLSKKSLVERVRNRRPKPKQIALIQRDQI